MACHGTAWCPLAHSARTQRDPAARVEVGPRVAGELHQCSGPRGVCGTAARTPTAARTHPIKQTRNCLHCAVAGAVWVLLRGVEKMVFLVATTFVNELRARVRLSSHWH